MKEYGIKENVKETKVVKSTKLWENDNASWEAQTHGKCTNRGLEVQETVKARIAIVKEALNKKKRLYYSTKNLEMRRDWWNAMRGTYCFMGMKCGLLEEEIGAGWGYEMWV